MSYLLDTGILLRLIDVRDANYASVKECVKRLGEQEVDLYMTTQNFAEFWNVATRPVQSNGLGLSPRAVNEAYESVIAPICGVLYERQSLLPEFKRLISTYRVIGKQVHDARLVAMMLTWNVMSILTLNERDFRRYGPEGIEVATPESMSGN